MGSIRVCFIQFAISFLVVGTNDLIREVLLLKGKCVFIVIQCHIVYFFIIGFLNVIFTLLSNDSTEVVYMVLNTLLEKVKVFVVIVCFNPTIADTKQYF